MSISIQHLTKVYGSQRAIDDISFEVGTGEIVGFLGPNGAGKSTTMKIATCFMPPTSGDVRLGELSVHSHSLEVRRRIGYLPEHNPLYLEMYVREFLRFVGRLYGMGGQELRKRVPEVVEMTGLGPEQHKKIGMLSKGYRQRVGLAQALVHDPEVLILDEPTTGLDPNQVVEIRRLIQSLGRQKTVLFSSHILSEVEAIADRVVIINKGKIVQDAPIAELRTQMVEALVVSVEFERPGFDFSRIQAMPGFLRLLADTNTRFSLHVEKNSDVRRLINEEAARQQNTIYAMTTEAANLEDIFRQLTGAN